MKLLCYKVIASFPYFGIHILLYNVLTWPRLQKSSLSATVSRIPVMKGKAKLYFMTAYHWLTTTSQYE